MQQRAGDNKVVQQVANELQQAGVASALPATKPCDACAKDLHTTNDPIGGVAPDYTDGSCYIAFPPGADRDTCLHDGMVKWCKCMKNNNCPGKPTIPQCADCGSYTC
jgi:hypothetical protein